MISDVLRSLLKEREYEFNVERAIYLSALHRLFASGSDRAAERWREDYLIPGTEGLELHHLYRAMAFLGEAIEQLEKPTYAVRCTKDLVEEALFESRRNLFTEVELVFFATTSLYFERQGGDLRRPPLQVARVNTLSDKSDSFFGEPAYWPACTQQARSGLGFSVEKRLTAKSSVILGDLGRVLPTTVPSDLSKFAFEFLPTALAVEPLTSQRTVKYLIHPLDESSGPLF